jgi:release factor glutamine methyltransferase
MTIREALSSSSGIETDLLLGHVLNKPKEFLLMNPAKNITQAQERKFKDLCKRRSQGEPVAYLLGYKYFFGLKFKVNPNVLIPRPESEWLVDRALHHLKHYRTPKVLDVGTGSGAIAIVLSKLQKIPVLASDISPKALAVARENNRALKAKVNFLHSNLLARINGQFDLIIANLPYVPLSDYKKLRQNLKYEPRLALTDGTDSSRLIAGFLREAESHLAPKGTVLLEIDPTSKKPIQSALTKKQSVKFFKDFRGLTRYAEIKWK